MVFFPPSSTPFSARSGGVSTLCPSRKLLRHSTQFLLIILMFIGAAGGGIKVTVFAILLGAIYAMSARKTGHRFFPQAFV